MSEPKKFVPSNVYAFFPSSDFNDFFQEVMAAHLVSFLAANGDKWDTVIEWEPFKDFCATAQMIDGAYSDPFNRQEMVGGSFSGLTALHVGGYIVIDKQSRQITVTEKLVKFYEFYVK